MLHLEYSSCFAANQQAIRNIYWQDVVTNFFFLCPPIFFFFFHSLVCGCCRILRHPQSKEWKGHWTDDEDWRELSLQHFPIFTIFLDWDKLVIRNLTRYSFNVFELLREHQKGEAFPYWDYIIFLHQILSNAKITLKTYMLENSWKYI